MKNWDIEIVQNEKGKLCIWINDAPEAGVQPPNEVRKELAEAIKDNKNLQVKEIKPKPDDKIKEPYEILTELEYTKDEAEDVRNWICECADDDKGYKINPKKITIPRKKHKQQGKWDIEIKQNKEGAMYVYIKDAPQIDKVKPKEVKRTLAELIQDDGEFKAKKLLKKDGKYKILTGLKYDKNKAKFARNKIREIAADKEYRIKLTEITMTQAKQLERVIEEKNIEYQQLEADESEDWEIVVSNTKKNNRVCIRIIECPEINGMSVEKKFVDALQEYRKIQIKKVGKKDDEYKLISKIEWSENSGELVKKEIIKCAKDILGYNIDEDYIEVKQKFETYNKSEEIDVLKSEIQKSKSSISKKDLENHKKLVSKYGNSIEYRIMWIYCYLFRRLKYPLPIEIKSQLFGFPEKGSPIKLKTLSATSLDDLSKLEFFSNIKNSVINMFRDNMFFASQVSESDPYLSNQMVYKNNEEKTAFTMAAKKLYKDILSELKNKEDLGETEDHETKSNITLMDQVLDILRKYSKKPLPPNLEESVCNYVEGGYGGYKGINGVLRETIKIIDEKGLGELFDPELYERAAYAGRTIKKAFKKGSDDSNIITKTSEDQHVLRGMDYVGLREMFKNGGCMKLPTKSNDFTKEIAKEINSRNDIIIFDKAVLSTSMTKYTLRDFAGQGVALDIFVPKGTESIDVAKDVKKALSEQEQELILPPKTALKVKRCSVDDSGIYLYLEVIN